MASAEAKKDVVESVTLTIQLTGKHEIDAMIHLLGKIGGHPDGPRGIFSKVCNALVDAGINFEQRTTPSPTDSKFLFPNTWEEFNSIPYYIWK